MTVRTAVAAAGGDDQPAGQWVVMQPHSTTFAVTLPFVPCRLGVIPSRTLSVATPTSTTTVVWRMS